MAPPCYPGPLVSMALPGGGPVTVDTLGPGSPDTLASDTGTVIPGAGQDVLSVTAGEPATHFNLDQLLSIVQSFQLDTTHAGAGRDTAKVCEQESSVEFRHIHAPAKSSVPFSSRFICI